MKFYNRESELAEFQSIWNQVDNCGKLVVLTGRRRLGKTILAREFVKELPFFYLFVEKKAEPLLCLDYVTLLQEKIPFPIVGEIKRFKEIFLLLLTYAKQQKIVVILDEFQEFFFTNPSIYSEIQHLWDVHKEEAKMLLIAAGSVYSLMHKIFEDREEPLFGRADRIIKIAPFSVSAMQCILQDHRIMEIQELFDFYVLTGGVPKYLDLFLSHGVKSKGEALAFMLRDFSPFLEEGQYTLMTEFGKEYGTYFAILELISLGKTSRSEVESILGCDVGGYIEKLEKTYQILYRVTPFGEKIASRRVKFAIKDLFLNFWFRFFYRNRSALELKNYSYVHKIIDRDYEMYAGKCLERFFIELLVGQKKYSKIGTYWEEKHLNEIDIVAVNDLEKKILLAEVKMNPKKINLYELQNKAKNLLLQYSDYKVEWAGLSLQDASSYL